MAVFSYLYYNNYIAKLASVSVGAVLNAVMQLDSKAQYELFSQLGNMLAAKRQIPGEDLQHTLVHQLVPLLGADCFVQGETACALPLSIPFQQVQ